MEGLRITGQTLFSDQDVETIKRETASVMSSEGMDVMAWERTITAESTLNTFEINLFPGDEGTRIDVNFGMSTLGVILTIIFLVLGGIIGVILLILWYLKMDDIKSSLKHAFPGYVPQPPQQQQPYDQGQQGQYQNPPPPPEQQGEQSDNEEWEN